MFRFPVRTTILTVIALSAIVGADAPWTKRDAESFKRKVDAITAFGESSSKLPRRTTVTENEVNAYFVFDAQPDLPRGVIDPSLTILGMGRVSARAVVDFDAIRKSTAPKSSLDPTALLGGKLPVIATGVLEAANGVGHFQLESATLGGVPIPKLVLQQVLSYYSRTPSKSGGISLDDAFQLPSRIREIQLERGQAIIIQ
jgi:hypothetical protein